MLLFRSQIGIAVLAEGVCLLVKIGADVDRALKLESRGIAACHAVVGHELQRVHPSAVDDILHPRFVRNDVGEPDFRIGLPTDLVAECCIVVDAQSKIQVVAVEPAEIVLQVATIAVQVAEPLVGIDGAGTAHDAHAVAYVLSFIETLMVMSGEVLKPSGEDVAEQFVVIVLPLTVELARDAVVVAVVVRHTACVGGSGGLHLRVNKIAVGLHQLVGVVAVVESKCGMEGKVLQWRELYLVGCLEALHLFLVVLKCLCL